MSLLYVSANDLALYTRLLQSRAVHVVGIFVWGLWRLYVFRGDTDWLCRKTVTNFAG
jgi:hypothetical protein